MSSRESVFCCLTITSFFWITCCAFPCFLVPLAVKLIEVDCPQFGFKIGSWAFTSGRPPAVSAMLFAPAAAAMQCLGFKAQMFSPERKQLSGEKCLEVPVPFRWLAAVGLYY